MSDMRRPRIDGRSLPPPAPVKGETGHYSPCAFKKFEARLIASDLFTPFKVDTQRLKQRWKSDVPGFQEGWKSLKDEYLEKVIQFEADGVALGKVLEKDPGERLRSLARKVSPEQEASREEILLWVGNHMGLEAREIDPATIPCRWAVILLADVTTDEKARRQFVGEFLSFSKNRVANQDGKQSGRDRHLKDLLGEVPQQARPRSTPDPDREPGLPAVALAGGGEASPDS